MRCAAYLKVLDLHGGKRDGPRAMTKIRCLLGTFLVLVFLAACAVESPVNVGTPDDYDPEPNARIAESPQGTVRLRLMAGNLTTGNYQSYEDPGIRIFRGLAPDVAMIQEFNYKTNSDADIRSFVDQAFGPDYSYVRGPGTEQIPNGVISRYPILDSGEWLDTQVSNPGFQWARIDIPGCVESYAISVHLLTRDAPTRDTQGHELVQDIGSVPAGAYVVLAGDFNPAVRDEPLLTTLAPVFATGGPYPVDLNGNGNTN